MAETTVVTMPTPCGWCGAPAVTEVVLRKGRVKRKTVPVCDAHAKQFEDQDIDTTRVEYERKQQAEEKRKAWKKRNLGGR